MTYTSPLWTQPSFQNSGADAKRCNSFSVRVGEAEHGEIKRTSGSEFKISSQLKILDEHPPMSPRASLQPAAYFKSGNQFPPTQRGARPSRESTRSLESSTLANSFSTRSSRSRRCFTKERPDSRTSKAVATFKIDSKSPSSVVGETRTALDLSNLQVNKACRTSSEDGSQMSQVLCTKTTLGCIFASAFVSISQCPGGPLVFCFFSRSSFIASSTSSLVIEAASIGE
mmetsp:Transcript_27330/g.49646  ORF Transcript_27330/g.49646 Transcript_27330/m.49646 type:complete len:228 (+) Transcript_27330:1843-2526(+)